MAVPAGTPYLSGFLAHLRGRVDGVVALDDGAGDAERVLLAGDPQILSVVVAAGVEDRAAARRRLVSEAARYGADWILWGRVDERFEPDFLRRLPRGAAAAGGHDARARSLCRVHLWDRPDAYRVDGPFRPRWTPRLFPVDRGEVPLPARAAALRVDAFVYTLAGADPARARHRAAAPANSLRPVPDGRGPTDLPWPPLPPLPDPAEFDDLLYRNHHPDVNAAVARGEFASGWEHFRRYGAAEGRYWRRRAALRGLDLAAIVGRRRAMLSGRCPRPDGDDAA